MSHHEMLLQHLQVVALQPYLLSIQPLFIHEQLSRVSHQDHVCVFRRVFLASLGKTITVTLIDGRVEDEDHQASGHHERPKECHANGLI